jgi:putative spermidine/putrescine transport system substrate-binding protein
VRASLKTLGIALTAGAALATAACAPPSRNDSGSSSSGNKAATATSVAEAGGLDALAAAAKKEGALNVIALPPDWANYGEIISSFTTKYGIKVNSANPAGTSQQEVDAVKQLKGTSRAPDVLDLGAAVTLANTDQFAPYKVATWADITDAQKEATGLWVNDYGGYMSVGYDSSKVPDVTSLADLTKPAYKNKVALNGDPTQAGAGLAGVQMVSLGNGGTVSDLAKGVTWFTALKKSGNFLPTDPTPASEKSGQTPVVMDWDYLNAAVVKDIPTWKTFVPNDALVGGYYNQAINKQAPHPAAARLWEEYLFSDEGQNLYLKGLARPVRMPAMTTAGTVDPALAAALPKITGTPVIPTSDDTTAASTYLASNWAKAIG